MSDNKGVVSDVFTAELKKKFKVEFNVQGGNYTPDTQYILKGDKVTKPSPDPRKQGHIFGGWYKDTTCSNGQEWLFPTDTVTSNMTLYAKWTPGSGTRYTVKHYQQNLNDDGYPASHTDIDNETGTTGQNATVTLKHYTGFKTGTYTATTIAADSSTVVEVRYEREKYAVRFNVDGSAGGSSISGTVVTGGSGTSASSVIVKHGGSVSFTAVPDTANNWEVEKWTVGGSVVPNHTSRTYTLSNIDGNKNVTVTFKKKFDVTFSVGYGQGGSLNGTYNGTTETTSGMQTIHVWEGGSVEFTALPDTANGWEVQSWMVDSAPVPGHTSETYTLSNVTQPKAVTVIFKKKTHTVTFRVDGGNGKIQVGSETPTTSGETQVIHNGSVTFTAKPDLGWEVDYWTSATENTPNTTATLSGVTTNGIDVKVRFKKITTVNAGDNGGKEWELLKKVVEIADNNAVITINGEIKATITNDNNGEIVINKNLTIKGKTGASSDKLNAITLSRIFKVNTGKTLTLENITLKNGEADNGGGVYNEGTLIMEGSATVAPSAGAGKNDVYLASGAMIIVNSSLTPQDGIAAYITPGSYAEERQVLDGSAVGSEYYKFEVTPESSTAEWVIKSDGCLKKAKGVVSSSSATPWKDLKTAITGAHDGDIIVINGEIKATDAPDNYGGITINKSITIKGKNKDTAILNANKSENGKPLHRIFYVSVNKTVTLQNLTLTGGVSGHDSGAIGGAILIAAASSSTTGSKVKMINCIIKDNEATGDGGGGVYIGSNGTFTMDGESSSITGNFVSVYATGSAVYIDGKGTFNWIKGSISNNGGSDKAVHKEPDGTFTNTSGNTAN